MSEDGRVGIRAVPADTDIAIFLDKLMEEYKQISDEKEKELADTIEQTIRDNEPPIFAFGKMLNYLAQLEKPELIEILAGTLWKRAW